MTPPTDIRKNANEVIRVERKDYKGHDLVDARVWYEDSSGEYQPSSKILSLRPETWDELLPVVEQALAAKAAG